MELFSDYRNLVVIIILILLLFFILRNFVILRKKLEKDKLFLGSFMIFLGFGIGVIAISFSPTLEGVGIMGICILVFMLIGANILSKERDLTTGEVRKAIAISFVSVFFGLLAIVEKININNSILKDVLENFWWIIVTIIGFYFGGRSAERIVESITGKWAKRLEDRVEKLEKAIQKKSEK